MPKGMGYSGDNKKGSSVTMKYGTTSKVSGGMSYKGQSGTVTKKGDTGPMPQPKANKQYNHGHKGKY